MATCSSYSMAYQRDYIAEKDNFDINFYKVRLNSSSRTLLHSSPIVDVIGLIAIDKFDEWKRLGGVLESMEVKDSNGWIVTGRMTIDDLRTIKAQSGFEKLEVSPDLTLMLSNTIKSVGLEPHIDRSSHLTGRGVIVGIIDLGCDFNHSSFKIDGRTRILSIWSQSLVEGGYFSRDQINEALQASDPYLRLGYGNFLEKGAHGTHVMDIAAGNSGMAPNADIIFVDLCKNVIDSSPDLTAKRVMQAAGYIFNEATARGQPCVINISGGLSRGAHDGTYPVERWFDNLVEEKNDRAIVLAVGNSYGHRAHYSGKIKSAVSSSSPVSPSSSSASVEQGQLAELTWNLAMNSIDILGIWYSFEDQFDLQILNLEDGQLSPKISHGQTYSFKGGLVAHHQDKFNGDNLIEILCDNKIMQIPRLKIILHGKVIKHGSFHAWIEGNSQFDDSDPSYTISSIATGKHAIAVGAYDACHPNHPVLVSCSSGPTRDERKTPSISAHGSYVTAAESKGTNIKMSGTSMAAPVVTGLIAGIFELARRHGKSLSIDQIRKAVEICSVPPPSTDTRYGAGKVFWNMENLSAFLTALPE